MAKICSNCSCKIGFSSGDHFDGLLCDNCYNELGGKLLSDIGAETQPDVFVRVYNAIVNEIDTKAGPGVDRDRIKQAFYRQFDLRCKRISNNVSGFEEYIQKGKNAIEREEKRVIYAKSFNEFYEYDVVTIINQDHGIVDKNKMMKILSEHAKNGWRLHTMYSNELGKNAVSLLGFGVNATACEDVLIFERRVQDLEQSEF